MEQQMQINVGGVDGQVLFGNHYHKLEDHTTTTYETDDLNAFVRFLKERSFVDFACYHNDKEVEAVPLSAYYGMARCAYCKVRPTWMVCEVRSWVGKWLSISSLEQAFRSLRDCLCQGGRSLYHNLPDFTVNKVLNYRRFRDHQGNYELQIKRSAGTDDVQIPGDIVLTVPIVQWCTEKRDIKLDVEFQVSEDGDKPVMQFMLRNPALHDILIEHTAQIVEGQLAELDRPIYRGQCNIHNQDDSWRYKPNGVQWA